MMGLLMACASPTSGVGVGMPQKEFLEQSRVRLSLEGLYLFNKGLSNTYYGPDFALGAVDLTREQNR